jgi:Secretion system C-terminal sorting domain/FG-GAP-like repeat
MRNLPLLLLLCWWQTSLAQLTRLNIPFFTAAYQPISNALAGGLANPQFSAVDIDGDGLQDLAIFDRVGNVWLTYKNNGSQGFAAYDFMPQWAGLLPKVEQWAMLRDFDNDGIADIFANGRVPTLGQIGIAVYKSSRSGNGLIRFALETPMIFYTDPRNGGISHLFVSNVDIPDVADMDYDGDLDVLTFNGLGGYVELYKNVSVDSGWGADSLRYVLADDCWGRFYESGLSEALDLSPRADSCARYSGWTPLRTPQVLQPRHAGSALTTIDINADRKRELLLSDISFDNIALVGNNGRINEAWAQSEITFYPNNNVAVSVSQFPAAYIVDINNDNKKDMLVSPSLDDVSQNVACVWLYENIGTDSFPVFDYVQNDYLVENMIDVGKGAAPVWVDYDGDGLLDIVLATSGFFINTTTATTKLSAYKNVGSATSPAYRLVDTNFADLRRYNLDRITVSFVDIDGDGDFDLLGGGEDGRIFYAQNVGTAQIANFSQPQLGYFNIDVGSNSVPTWADLDGDGDFDLVVGERNGNLNYYNNIGTATNANFSATVSNGSFGLIDARQLGSNEGNAAPILVEWGGRMQLITGAEFGGFYWHDSIIGNLGGGFNNVSERLNGLDEGRQSIGSVADINADGFMDILVGNKRGGIGIFSYNPSLIGTVKINEKVEIRAYPNPATHEVQIICPEIWADNEHIKVEIYDVAGRLLTQISNFNPTKKPINIQEMPTGLLILKVIYKNETSVIKLLKIN